MKVVGITRIAQSDDTAHDDSDDTGHDDGLCRMSVKSIRKGRVSRAMLWRMMAMMIRTIMQDLYRSKLSRA